MTNKFITVLNINGELSTFRRKEILQVDRRTLIYAELKGNPETNGHTYIHLKKGGIIHCKLTNEDYNELMDKITGNLKSKKDNKPREFKLEYTVGFHCNDTGSHCSTEGKTVTATSFKKAVKIVKKEYKNSEYRVFDFKELRYV